MQWHVHDNLCWGSTTNGKPNVVGVTDADGNCPPGGQRRRREPDGPRVDHAHGAACSPRSRASAPARSPPTGERPTSAPHAPRRGDGTATRRRPPEPYDPTQPIDLGGTPGVTPEQQAAAENLVAVTLAASRSGATRRSPRPPASTPSATAPPATSTSSSGTGSTTTSRSTPTTPRASCTSRSPTAQEARVGDVHAARTTTPSTTCPTSAAR